MLTRLLAGLVSVCLAVPALAAVTAELDRNRVYAGDPVTLSIESDTHRAGEPDLAPLNADFKVLGSSTSTRISIINGRRSDTTRWSVQLEPRRKGTLRIPPISVGGEQTRSLELVVSDIPAQVSAQHSAHVFLEVEADTGGQSLYVQQQIPYTVRLYYDERILNGELQAPQPEQAVVEQLGEDKQYAVTRNARRYNVIERRYAISPQRSGPLRIPPASFKGQIAAAQNPGGAGTSRQRLFERFFSGSPFDGDPFFSNTPFAPRSEPVRIRSQAVEVDVLPRPASATGTWLPAEQLVLRDSWSEQPPQLRAGEPVTRTLTLQAKGLSAAQLPALQLQQPAQARLYPEAPVNENRTDGNTVYAISKQSFTYIPSRAGTLTIPAFELEWWNTQSNQAASARLPQWEFNVEQGSGVSRAPPPDTPENTAVTAAEQPSPSPAPAPAPQAAAPARFATIRALGYWPLAAAVSALLVAVLFAARRRHRARPATTAARPSAPAAQDNRATIRTLMTQLQRACAADDAGAAARMLLQLARAHWPEDPPRNLGALAGRLPTAHAQIMSVDRALYAAGDEKWRGAELWQAVRDAWQSPPAEKKTPADGLKPLYPQDA